MMFALSERAQDFITRTKPFIQQEIEPIEKAFWDEVHQLNVDGDWTKMAVASSIKRTISKPRLKQQAYGICFCPMRNWVLVYRFRNMHIF